MRGVRTFGPSTRKVVRGIRQNERVRKNLSGDRRRGSLSEMRRVHSPTAEDYVAVPETVLEGVLWLPAPSIATT